MTYLLFACGVIMFLFAVTQLLTAAKQPVHYYMSIACFALAYLLLLLWAAETGGLVYAPALAGSHISIIFLAAPAFYLASLSIIRGGSYPARYPVAYFAAPVLFALGFGLHRGLAGPGTRRAPGEFPGYFDYPLLMIASAAFFAAAVGLTLYKAHRLNRAGKARKIYAYRIQVVFLSVYLVESALYLAACVLSSDRLLVGSAAAFGLTATLFTLTCTGIVFFAPRSPFSQSRDPSDKREWDDSEKLLASRIEKLMDESAPYTDPDLTIEKLSRMLKVDVKALSRFFNARLRTTFRGYINDLRLRAACRGLLENPDATILETAFAVGFNSKTSFNTLFSKAYGMSPREYRSSRGAAGKDESPASPASAAGGELPG